jgi:pyruvate, water dikinase
MMKFMEWFRKNAENDKKDAGGDLFQQKYDAFRRLLDANNRALEIIAEMETVVYDDKPFTLSLIRTQSDRLLSETAVIADQLNRLSRDKYTVLSKKTDHISELVRRDLNPSKPLEPASLVLPLQLLSLENAAEVGGKAANLGEICNRAHLPVPPGFAVSAYACQQFLDQSRLAAFIEDRLGALDVNDTEHLITVSEEIRSQILQAALPAELERAIQEAAAGLKFKLGPDFRLAVRSSATSEDSEASFAGQHSTILNVGEANLVAAYKDVVSSTFNPRAIFYRRQRGYPDQHVIMSVACIAMIDAMVSGVMYTVDPNDSRHGVVMISALWGLAEAAVDGSAPTDFFQIDKSGRRIEQLQVALKRSRLRCHPGEGVVAEPVPDSLIDKACLENSQIVELVDAGITLERHYGYALDIEWAIDHKGKLFILQARPLKRSQPFGSEINPETAVKQAMVPSDTRLLLEGGATASDGVAAGFAYVLQNEHNLHHIPKGAVLVARQTSPRYVPLMGRIQAIVTDVGSVTGHMASVAREFRIPTLVGTGNGTDVITHGEQITVDAAGRKVYLGRVEALLHERKPINPMKGSPVYRMAKTALKRIAPLNLVDSRAETFTPEACETIHDIIRYAHEISMQEMFRIGETVGAKKHQAINLRIYLPMQILVIDLGGGLALGPADRIAEIHQVTSVPFKAMIAGMKHENVNWLHDVGVSFGGLMTIVAETVLRDPMKEGRMGGPNYAVVSEHYLNFNSRLGYHFAIIDTYCGPVVNDNYITFQFKGGAADIGRRSRRAALISLILKRLGFRVEQKGDMVRSELKKYESADIRERLDMIGRLLGSVRLLDMVLADDRQVEWYVDQFFKGNYTFDPHWKQNGA